jgi:hypothetical protein
LITNCHLLLEAEEKYDLIVFVSTSIVNTNEKNVHQIFKTDMTQRCGRKLFDYLLEYFNRCHDFIMLLGDNSSSYNDRKTE